jgi:hypothetical protein
MSQSWHRPLSEMLSEVLGGVQTADAEVPLVRIRSVELSLPVEVSLRELDGEETLIADLPVWRWRTYFDQPVSKLSILWEEQAS